MLILAIFSNIKNLFSKAGDVGGSVSLDTSGAASFATDVGGGGVPTSGVNFLDQPQTTLTGGGTTPPPAPIVIKNVISEHEVTSVQNSVLEIASQATIH